MRRNRRKVKKFIGIWMLVLLVMAGVSVVKFRFSVEGYAAETGETSGTEDNTETTGETEPTSGECGENLKWDLSDDGTLTISGTGKMDSWSYENETSPWYKNTDIKQVVIEEGVTSIGAYAFYYCSNLTSVTIPEGVVTIGKYAFAVCASLTGVKLPDSLTSIGTYAFYSCGSLTEITVPENVTRIEERTFCSCGSLKKVTLLGEVTTIGKFAFGYDDNLVDINLPASVNWISDYAFQSCDNLEEITIPDGVTNIGIWAFSGCKSFNENYHSRQCENHWKICIFQLQQLTEIVIPSSVRTMGEYAFSSCTGLKEVTILANFWSGHHTFYNCSSLEKVILSDKVSSIGRYAFFGCSSLTEIVLPDSVDAIGDYAFCSCESLKKINIPDAVDAIGEWAFYGCSSLTEITLPDGMTAIKEWVFASCSQLAKVDIPDSVTSIGKCAFRNCDSLTDLPTMNGVTTIKDSAFFDCNGLTEITIPDGVKSIGYDAFGQCENLKKITLPDTVTSIEHHAFYWCSSLEEITLPDKVDSIRYCTFANCKSLREIIIPSSVKTIEQDVFAGSDLKYIYYSGSKEEWEKIAIDSNNVELQNATIFYNSTGPVIDGVSGTLQCSSVFSVERGKTGSIIAKAFENDLDRLTELAESVKWTSADESIAVVEGGELLCGVTPNIYETEGGVYKTWDAIGRIRIRGVSAGSTTVTGKADDGTAVTCKVTVAEPEDPEGGGPGSGGSLTIGEDIGGSADKDSGVLDFFPDSWSLKSTIFPVEIRVKDKGDCYLVRGTVGIRKADWLDEDSTWNQFKENVADARKYTGRINCLDKYADTWNVKSLTAVTTNQFNVLPKLSVMGYIENTYDKNWNLISETGKLAANAKWEGSINWQFATPIGPLYLNLNGSGNITANVGPKYDYKEKKLDLIDGSMLFTPSVALEGGYGINKVATIGAEGKLSLPITLIPATKGELEAKAALKVHVVFVLDFSHDLATYRKTLWGEANTLKSKSIQARRGAVFSTGTLSEIDTSSLNDASAWNTENRQMAKARTRSAATDTEVTLLDGVLKGSLPMQAEVGGKRVMVFQSYDSARTTLNSPILMYSVCENNAWSEPKAVWDTGTADLYADMKVVNGQLVLVWQKEKAETTGDVTNDSENVLKQLAYNSEICFSVFDEETGTFSEPVYVTDNGACDMMPRLCDNSDEVVISWVRNDAADLMQRTGSNTIYIAAWDSDSGTFGEEKELVKASGTVDDYVLYENKDTVEAMFTGQAGEMTAMFDTDGHVMEELSDLFMFSEDGSISGIQYVDGRVVCVSNGTLYVIDPADRTVEKFLAGESAFGAEIQYASNGDKSGYVWSLYDEETGKGKIVASMKTENGYSEPVTLYEKDDVIWRYVSPAIDENGNWRFVTNAEDLNEQDSAGENIHSIISIVKEPETGVVLAGASVDTNDRQDGKTGVDYFLTNKGDTPINELELTITLPDGEKMTQKVPVNILPGEDAIGTAYVDLSDVNTTQNVQISVYEEGQTDINDCTVTDTVGLPDVSVTGSCTEDDETVQVTAVVSNDSTTDAEVSLSLFGDETQQTELEKKDSITLQAKEKQHISFTVPKNRIVYNEKDAAYLTVKAETAGGDYDESDNIAYVVLYKEKTPEINPGGDPGSTTENPGATTGATGSGATENEPPTTGATDGGTTGNGTSTQPSGAGSSVISQPEPVHNNEADSLPPVGTTWMDTRTNALYMVTEAGVSVAYVKNLNPEAAAAVVPSAVTFGDVTYQVTSIGNNAFKNDKKLKKVTIAGSVTSIGNAAFRNCGKLKKIVIPAKVEKIGKKAFYNCKNLRSIIVRAKKLTARSVGSKAFTKAGSKDYRRLKVKAPAKKYGTYRKIFRKKGLSSEARMTR